MLADPVCTYSNKQFISENEINQPVMIALAISPFFKRISEVYSPLLANLDLLQLELSKMPNKTEIDTNDMLHKLAIR